jgi:hypothetical protein
VDRPPQIVLPTALASGLHAARRRCALLATALEQPCETAVDLATEWEPSDRRPLEDALEHLDRRKLARAFPRDDKGRPLPKVEVPLVSLSSDAPQKRGRSLWLVARGPSKVKAPITIAISSLFYENCDHRWDDRRSDWDDRVADDRDLEAARTPAAREATALQDEGRFGEALARFGVTLGDGLRIALAGTPSDSYYAAHRWPLRWQVAAVEQLWAIGPWKLAAALAARVAWRRLPLLPGQTRQVKAAITILPGPSLLVDESGSNARLAETQWRRPITVDVARLGRDSPAS